MCIDKSVTNVKATRIATNYPIKYVKSRIEGHRSILSL